ncbi:MAG: DUF1016 N-terminal domain-containing protein [Methanomassiliicoccaceae archaeon]|nr:DUF1016 N-terminal domain-containing protein [Methanomassiliicoccaceae archaeon]
MARCGGTAGQRTRRCRTPSTISSGKRGRGRSAVEVLSKELRKEFPGVRGFSARNLWLMRNFSSNIQKTQFCNHQLQKYAGLKNTP